MRLFERLKILIFVTVYKMKRKYLPMKKLVILTGAGMSAESGISTFRDSGGLWDRYPVEQVATPEGYAANPKLVIDFYNERRKQLLTVKPNRGHELIAELENFFDVTVVTQNVDNLHERAGSHHVIHLHGELTKVTSSWQPNNPKYIKELKPEDYEVKMGDTAADGSQLRPFIVWFGEAVPMIETAIDYAEQADICHYRNISECVSGSRTVKLCSSPCPGLSYRSERSCHNFGQACKCYSQGSLRRNV